MIAGLPLEPIILAEVARAQGVDTAALGVDALFLGGSPLPPAMQRRMARAWNARVIELYGSTETMLLGTSCVAGTLHVETTLAYCEVLDQRRDAPVEAGAEQAAVVTTIGVDGSPLVRFETATRTTAAAPRPRRRAPWDRPRPSREAVAIASRRCTVRPRRRRRGGGRRRQQHLFVVVSLTGCWCASRHPARTTRPRGPSWRPPPGVATEVELSSPACWSTSSCSGGPHVYKPVVVSDWRRPGRRILTAARDDRVAAAAWAGGAAGCPSIHRRGAAGGFPRVALAPTEGRWICGHACRRSGWTGRG